MDDLKAIRVALGEIMIGVDEMTWIRQIIAREGQCVSQSWRGSSTWSRLHSRAIPDLAPCAAADSGVFRLTV